MRFRVILFLLLFYFSVPAQQVVQASIDSIQHALLLAKDDTDKVKLFQRITQLYVSRNPREGFKYANAGLALAQKLQWKRGIANLNNSLGLMTGDTGNNAGSRVYFEKSLAINKEQDEKAFMLANMNNIGRSYERETNFTKASEYYFKAMEIADESGNDEQAALLGTNITSLFIIQGDYLKAAKYADLTIKKGTAAHALLHVAKGYELLGIINLEAKDTDAARKNFDKALAIDEKLDNKMAVVSVLTNIGSGETDPRKAIGIFRSIQKILDSIAPASQNSILNLANLGLNYYDLGKTQSGEEKRKSFDSSEIYLVRGGALCKSTNNPEFEADIKQVMANLQEAKGNYKAALDNYRQFTGINDSIFSQGNKNKIAALENQRAIDLKNKEIETSKLEIDNQQKKMLLLISSIAFLIITGGILYRQSLIRKRTNTTLLQLNNELDEANKIKAKFFAILSHDLRSPVANLINFLQLQKRKPGLLSEEQIENSEQKITASAQSLLETMEAMLLWSKGQMEHFKPTIQTVEVNHLFQYLNKTFSESENIRFVYSNPQNLTVLTDENYLQTIMHNLTSNAVKALKKTSEAKIEWRAYEQGGKTILSISDNGPGLTAEYVYTLHNETVAANSKTGLGLHLIRDLAKAIQCSISVQSKPGGGTTFSLFA
jgi:signal transduction histidine kinase